MGERESLRGGREIQQKNCQTQMSISKEGLNGTSLKRNKTFFCPKQRRGRNRPNTTGRLSNGPNMGEALYEISEYELVRERGVKHVKRNRKKNRRKKLLGKNIGKGEVEMRI